MDSFIKINRMMRKAQDAGPDWEQRRYEIAKNIMTAIMTTAWMVCDLKKAEEPAKLAKLSLTYTDALIEELKRDSLKKEKK